MRCTTIKVDTECFFMTPRGCTYPGGACKTIVADCEGCDHVQEWPTGRYCSSTADPAARWTFGTCNMATHVKIAHAVEKKKVNPLKASKRAGGRR